MAADPSTAHGVRSEELLALKQRYVAPAFFHVTPVVVERAQYPATLYDVDGRRYVDFAAGIGVMNVGHQHPEVLEAARQQMERCTHLGFHVVVYEPYLRLAEAMDRIFPRTADGDGGARQGAGPHAAGPSVEGGVRTKSIFVNSGAEAVENAIKIARAATGREFVIAFTGAFHGRTYAALQATGKTKPSRYPFLASLPPHIVHAPYPYLYRAPVRFASEDEATAFYLAQVEHLLDTVLAPERVAAVLIEPVQGEGGFVVPPRGFLQGLRRLCDRHGILFISDEVQAGFGRTGHWFGVEHHGVVPDLIATAKGLGAGWPLGGVTGRAEIMDRVPPWALGSTFGGHPVACAAALKAIEVMERDGLLLRARRLGEHIAARFREWQERFPFIGDVRGLGAMQAFEVVRSREGREPDPDRVARIMEECWRRGLITIRAGLYGNVVRTLVPLTITDAELGEGLAVLEVALERAA